MGQKVNPIGLRLGINKVWDSRWFASKNYASLLIEDLKIRAYVMKAFKQAVIGKVVIERPTKKAIITIHAARPGVIIGKKGADIEKLKSALVKMTKNQDLSINIVEIRKPELDATIVAQSIAQQIENRASYRRAMKKAMTSTLRMGAEGIRVMVSGRLSGSEIARDEEYLEGRVPLHTLRVDIDYSCAEAFTTYGVIGVKVWISRGEVFGPHDKSAENVQAVVAQPL